MTTFVLVAGLATVAALAWVLWPLVRRHDAAPAPAAREATNLAILRAQLAELEAEHARGAMSDAVYAEAKAELERRALEDVAPDEAAPAAAPARGTGGIHVVASAIALALGVPLAAIVIYAQLGSPEALSLRADGRGDAAGGAQVTQEQVEQMVAQLAERMKNEPDNAAGWAMLGRSYYAMQRYDDAVRAYEALVKLLPQDPDALADYADALAMARGRKLAGEPMELVKKALAANPNHMKSLAMAGSDAFERGDFAGAVDYWTRLRRQLPDDVQVARNIDGSIAEARARLAAAGGAGGTAGSESKGAKGDTQAAAARSISGRVALAPELASRAQAGDTVFIVARAAQGSRMPLAVRRLQVKDLPADFTLDDSMAMTPAMRLSSARDVVIVARVSKSGAATPAAGDLEGTSAPVQLGARDVSVTIDRVLP